VPHPQTTAHTLIPEPCGFYSELTTLRISLLKCGIELPKYREMFGLQQSEKRRRAGNKLEAKTAFVLCAHGEVLPQSLTQNDW
jgi:hypothetical protein